MTEVVPPPKGLQPQGGSLESTESLCTSPAQLTHGFVYHLRARDRRQGARAPQAGQLERLLTVRVAPISSLLRAQRWSHAPAVIAFWVSER